MHTGVSSYRVVWQGCCERYTRVLMEASPEFPIHFLKIYSIDFDQRGGVSREPKGHKVALRSSGFRSLDKPRP